MNEYELYDYDENDEANLHENLDVDVHDLDTNGERVKFLYEVINTDRR